MLRYRRFPAAGLHCIEVAHLLAPPLMLCSQQGHLVSQIYTLPTKVQRDGRGMIDVTTRLSLNVSAGASQNRTQASGMQMLYSRTGGWIN